MEFTAEYVPEVINITKIKEGFYIGDEIAGTNLDVIIQFKLTHMINATGNQIQNKWETLGIKYLTINWRDIPSQMLFDSKDELANKIVSFVDDALSKGEGLLGFSYTSQSRICIVVVIYLMKKFKWSLNKCIEFIKSRKNDVNIQKYFITQLVHFEKRLIQKGEGIKAIPWSVDDIKDPEEKLLRNTYVNSLISDPKLIPKDGFEIKKRRHIGWADKNSYKKEPLIHINQAMDLCFQKDVKNVTVHKRMRPSRSCMKHKKGSNSNTQGNIVGNSNSSNSNVNVVNVNVNASAMQLGQQQRSNNNKIQSGNNNNNNVNSVSLSQQVSKGIMSTSTSLPNYVMNTNNVTGIRNINSVSVNDLPSKKDELFNNNVNVGIGVGVGTSSLNNNSNNKYSQNTNSNNFTLPLQQRMMSSQQIQTQKTDSKYFGQNLTQQINNGLFIQDKINNYLQATNTFINNIQQQKQTNIDNSNSNNNIMYNTPSFGNDSSNVFNINKHSNTLPLQNELPKSKETKMQIQQQQQQPHHQLLNIPKQFSDKNIKSNTLNRDQPSHMQFSPAIVMNQHNNIQNRTLSKDIANNKLFQSNFSPSGNSILNINHQQQQQQPPSLMKNPCKLIYIYNVYTSYKFHVN